MTLEQAGLGTFKGGTLHPLLTRFETAAWVEVDGRHAKTDPAGNFSRAPEPEEALASARDYAKQLGAEALKTPREGIRRQMACIALPAVLVLTLPLYLIPLGRPAWALAALAVLWGAAGSAGF